MKNSLKALANAACWLLVIPFLLLYLLGSLLFGRRQAFAGWSQAFALVPGLCGVYLRRAFYRHVCPECGADACLGFGVIFSHPTARIGARVYVGPFCCLGDVTLGEDVLLGSHVSIANGTAQHGIERLDIPIREQPGTWPRITIGPDSWIGDRAVILANVGKHCVIGAGSVVAKPVPDYAVALGVPAKVIRFRRSAAGDSPAPRALVEAGC